MTLKDVKDWLKEQVSADIWKLSIYDNQKPKTISLGTDKNDIYEYVIETWITYMCDGKA